MDKCEVKKLVIHVEGQDVTITVTAARVLRDALTELFGEKSIIYVPMVTYPEHPHWPYRRWEPYFLCATTDHTTAPVQQPDTLKQVQ